MRPRGERRTLRRRDLACMAAAVIAIVAVMAVTVVRESWQGPAAGPRCQVGGTSGTFSLSLAQMEIAETIATVASRGGLPDHAVTVALATALQESRLVNLPGGDRDSAGVFQQRPSQGWGTYQQVTDPAYAATAFFAALDAERGWGEESVARAAQGVQHSAAPLAYARWEGEARELAAALTGEQPAGLRCTGLAASTAIVIPAAGIQAHLASELGTLTLGRARTSARGWAIATWLEVHAGALGLASVTFDGSTWTLSRGAWVQIGSHDLELRVTSAPASRG